MVDAALDGLGQARQRLAVVRDEEVAAGVGLGPQRLDVLQQLRVGHLGQRALVPVDVGVGDVGVVVVAHDHGEVLGGLVQPPLDAQRLVAGVDHGGRADGEARAQRHNEPVHELVVAEALDLLRGHAGRVQGGQRHVGQEAEGRQVPLARVGHVEQRVVDGAARRLGEAETREEVGPAVEVADARRALDEVAHALGHLHHRLVDLLVLQQHRGLQGELPERPQVGPRVGEVDKGPVLAVVVLHRHGLPGAREVGRHGVAQPAHLLAPGGQVQHHPRLGVLQVHAELERAGVALLDRQPQLRHPRPVRLALQDLEVHRLVVVAHPGAHVEVVRVLRVRVVARAAQVHRAGARVQRDLDLEVRVEGGHFEGRERRV